MFSIPTHIDPVTGFPRNLLSGTVEIRSSMTWVCPDGVYSVNVTVCPCGGGGAGGNAGDGINGGLGGGGGLLGIVSDGIFRVIPGVGYVVAIGAGGIGGTAGTGALSTPGGAGGIGGATSFSNLLTVSGGLGGVVGDRKSVV